jgi:hypothetical protein
MKEALIRVSEIPPNGAVTVEGLGRFWSCC